MWTEDFYSTFLGQDVVITINGEGKIEDVKFKHFPNLKIELSDKIRRELESENEDTIIDILQEDERESREWDEHIRIESDPCKFI